MTSWLISIFDTSGFPPRWHCGVWTALHGWTHIVSDVIIFAAYFTIPCLLVYFVRKRRDLPFGRIFWLFAFFILSCGTVHLVEATIFWHPWYRLSAVAKMLTAVVSVATVIALIPVIPRALAMPGLASQAERLKAEIESHRQLEERFELAVESAPNGIAIIDEQGCIVLLNRQAEEMFGYARDELIGQPVEKLIPSRFAHMHAGHRREYCADPTARKMGEGRDLFGLRKDGSEFPVEIGLNPIRTSDGLLVLSAIVDITERKRIQSELEQYAEQLELRTTDLADANTQLQLAKHEVDQIAANLVRSNAELEQFAYIASHDLQEPLRTVTSYVQLLERRYADHLDTDARDFINYAVDGSARMKQLITDLLQYSRVDTKGREFTQTESQNSLDAAIANLRSSITETNATVTHGPLPKVMADGGQLTRLFQNLIGNAVKFRGKTPPCVHVSAVSRGGQWVFSVRDNGIGFEPQYGERIFRVFQRLHTREAYPGSGIGLAICKKIVERHGGRIWVDSVPEVGTTFCFTIPIRKETEAHVHGIQHGAN